MFEFNTLVPAEHAYSHLAVAILGSPWSKSYDTQIGFWDSVHLPGGRTGVMFSTNTLIWIETYG